MSIELIPTDVREKWQVHEWKHACAILERDFQEEWEDLLQVLRAFRISRGHLLDPGGNKSLVSRFFDSAFRQLGWVEKGFDTRVVVDEREMCSPTHKVDCFKNGVAVEIEWNNKDPFYDRDLNNFRLLFELRAISVGVIITRTEEILLMPRRLDPTKKICRTTTYLDKLLPRLEGGSGGGCPILVFGMTAALMEEAVVGE